MYVDMCTQNLAAKASKSAISACSGDFIFCKFSNQKEGISENFIT